jgi:4-hydroxybenzoate polyprenyltransferase
MNPSDLPWWAWIGIALALAVISFLVWAVSDSPKHPGDQQFLKVTSVLLGGVATLVGIIGLVRFIKWIWQG